MGRIASTTAHLVTACGSLALAVGLVSTSAAAQTAPDKGEAEETTEIIVTAQRQSQTLQSVPIAVSAFNQEALERQQIRNSSDLQLTLPNIVFTKTQFTASSFTIRGVGDLCVGVSCDAATGVHINGSPIPATRIFESEFFDLERIEVLRGPQGTLFGRNATSGVLNIVTAKPSPSDFSLSAEGEYGNYDAIKFKGMVNLPITETLAVRAAGYYHKRDGYTLNLYDNSRVDDRDMFGLRASLRWQPTSDTTLDLMASYFKEDDKRLRIQKQLCQRDPIGVLGCLPSARGFEYFNGNAQVVSTLPSVQTLTAATGPLAPFFAPLGLTDVTGADVNAGRINPADFRQIRSPYSPFYKASEQQFQATLEHDFGPVSLELQGAYSKTSVDTSVDPGQSTANRALYANALNTLANYAANGLPGIPMSAAFFAPAAAALMPNGPNGILCTSLGEATGTGVFGGNRVCGNDPITLDRSRQKTETWSVEAILASKLDGPLNFLVGGTYLTNKVKDNDYYVASFGLDYASAVLGAATALGRTLQGAPTPPSYLGPPVFDSATPDFRLKSYGLFGEVYFEPSDKLKITLGARYNNDRKRLVARGQLFNFLVPYGTTDAFATPFGAGYDADPSTLCPTTNAVTGSQSSTTPGAVGSVLLCDAFQRRSVGFNAWTGRAVIDYRITPDNLIYASYSRGYKSGGINPPIQAGLPGNTNYRPEYVNAFEIGSKNNFGNGQLTLNATAFYYQYKGMQLSRIINRTAINDNVDSDIYGLELEAVIRPARGWQVNMAGSYLHTKVTGSLFLQNSRDPAAGRSDVVVLKDLQAAFNCVVIPNVAGNAVGANTLVTAFNSAIGLPGPRPFPVNSGVAATGAHSLCNVLAGTVANPNAGLRALFATPTGPLPFSVVNVGIAQDIKGKQLPQAPNYKWNVGVQYEAELGGGLTLVPRADLIYTGESFGNIFNGPVNRIKGYTQINAQLQLNGADERWFARAYVQNLGGGNPLTGLVINDQSQGVATNVFTLEPRRYGIAVGVKF